MTPPYAAFPLDEHKARLARARAALAEAGFAGAVAVAPETLYYLAGYDAWVAVPLFSYARHTGDKGTTIFRTYRMDTQRPPRHL